MPMVAATIQQQMAQAIQAAMDTAFPDGLKADPTSHQKMAAAIAQGVATVLYTTLTTQATVLPGIGTAGSPAAQTSVTPGKIF